MQRLSVATAGQLLDFSAGGRSPISDQAADEQLEGAVAIHNILAERGVAYLADEVGMGKTYVALGTMALLRHFKPDARMIVIAPRENIQKKWLKELRNFIDGNVRFADLRTKSAHGAPARSPVFCSNVPNLIHETVLDSDRDFFARMTSFSLALGKDSEGWKRVRDDVLKHVPWLDRELFDLRNRERFKENVGRALNAALPDFDLVVVDEGHNLKHGLGSGTSTRNRLISLAFGHPGGAAEPRVWHSYGSRARRVLFLSATPLEDDFRQLWNQLDVFGKGDEYRALLEDNDPAAQRECAAKFMVRRVFALNVNGQRLTKNLYRREWRLGGVATHDDPIDVVDPKQQLVVALVQKKVSELLGDERFNNSFQVGMLASFESFMQTAGVAADEEESIFDDADQAVDLAERQGLDVHAVNRMAADYRRRFQAELPHPKMDALVDRLQHAFGTGEKTLVFVRRVASVDELRRKLNERYDAWVTTYLRHVLRTELHSDLDNALTAYREHRLTERQERLRAAGVVGNYNADEIGNEDVGGEDSFFAWWFRGQTPVPGLLSGGQFALRFNSAGAMLGTFFEDNHVAAVLSVSPNNVTGELQRACGMQQAEMAELLRAAAGRRLTTVKRQQRGTVFLAYQAAALALLAERAGGELAQHARLVLAERLGDMPEHSGGGEAPALERRLETRTFWTELRARPALCTALWPESTGDYRSQFRRRELRRELLSSMARLGHPLIDLYASAVNTLDDLTTGARLSDDVEVDDVQLIEAYLDCLEEQSQSDEAWNGYRELKAAADHFDLIIMTNEPEARSVALYEASRLFGRLLRAQEPVGGMSGQVNETMVRQFRMPGYPLILVTTELLREGEDLHTFCANVVHYGIAWMPSSTEQRVGRVDRVSSLTERRLLRTGTAAPDDLLQVYYPHLRDTVERMQVETVIRRQYDFIRLMHEGFGTGRGERTIDVQKQATRTADPLLPITEPLKTAYPVRPEMLSGADLQPTVGPDFAQRLAHRFTGLRDALAAGVGAIEWEEAPPEGALLGTRPMKNRVQPFTLLLRSTNGLPLVRCVSPIGVYSDLTDAAAELLRMADVDGVRVCAVPDVKMASYNLTVDGDVLLGDEGQDVERAVSLLDRVTTAADRMERRLLEWDHPMQVFRKDLGSEVDVDR